MLTCPNCGSHELRRSHSRNIREHLMKMTGRMAFRCRSCEWRGMLKVPRRSLSATEWMKWIIIYSFMTACIVFLAATYSEWTAFLSGKSFAFRVGVLAAAILAALVLIYKMPPHGILRVILVSLVAVAVLMSIPAVFF
jgi:hypothetical protein